MHRRAEDEGCKNGVHGLVTQTGVGWDKTPPAERFAAIWFGIFSTRWKRSPFRRIGADQGAAGYSPFDRLLGLAMHRCLPMLSGEAFAPQMPPESGF